MIDSQINRISNLHGASHSKKPPIDVVEQFLSMLRCDSHAKLVGKTFSTTIGTIFYRKHAQEDEILEVLALLAEGNRINTLTRVKDIKENTASFPAKGNKVSD